MNTTERQAQIKLCPLDIQPLQPQSVGGGAIGVGAPPARCVASDCMMWRWDEEANSALRPRFAQASGAAATAIKEQPRPSDVPVAWVWCAYEEGEGYAGWLEPEDLLKARRVGYCGLAGNPRGGLR